MDAHAAAILGLLLGAVLANLAFLPPRCRGWVRCAAMPLLYGAWMGLCALLAAGASTPHALPWQAWFASSALFAVLAFPGIVWRHLRR